MEKKKEKRNYSFFNHFTYNVWVMDVCLPSKTCKPIPLLIPSVPTQFSLFNVLQHFLMLHVMKSLDISVCLADRNSQIFFILNVYVFTAMLILHLSFLVTLYVLTVV